MVYILPRTRWKSPPATSQIMPSKYTKWINHSTSSMWIILAIIIFQSLIPSAYCQEGEKKLFSIEENLPAGRIIGKVDNRLGYTYQLATSTDYFTVDQSGDIRTKQEIDRESLNSNEIKFVVKQSQSPTSHVLIEVIVTILDLNDNSPRFTSNTVNYTLLENEVPEQPFTLTATDPDASINGSNSLTYTIVSGNGDGYFGLTTTTAPGPKFGKLAVLRAADREDVAAFQLVIRAQDGGIPAKFALLTVNVKVTDLNDNPPLFDMSAYKAEVLENATVGSRVLQVIADDEDTGFNSFVVYSMTPNTLFGIDPDTGDITLQSSLLNEGYTAEPTICQYSYCNTTMCLAVCVLEIQAADQEGRGTNQLRDQGSVRITINDVNNYAPQVSLVSKTATVSEDARVNTLIFRMTVTDVDKGVNAQFDFRYLSGNQLNHFKPPQCFGKYCFVRLNAPVDKEAVPSYNLTFAVSDRGAVPLTTYVSVIVNVLDANDHSPVFSRPSYSATVSELDPVDSYVAAVTATDADEDENGRVTYAIVSGNSDQFFKIDSDSGLVTVNRPVDSDNMDIARISLNVSASDHGSTVLRTETTLVVDIIDENDEIPTFTEREYQTSIEENNPINVTVITLSATDGDKGANGSVRYRLSEQMTTTHPGLFHIGSTSGELKVMRSLDREMESSYEVHVIAHDLGPIQLSSEVKVVIDVTDVNDNRPVFYPVRYYAVVPETASVGFKVETLTATDADSGSNGIVRYQLFQQSGAQGRFTVHPTSGVLSISAALPSSVRSYTIEVDATDIAGRSAVSKAIVKILVSRPSEEDPKFAQDSYTFTVTEDADGTSPAIGQSVGTVTATGQTVLKYFISDGDTDLVFTVNENTGTITTTKRLDREAAAEYHLTVVAQSSSKIATTSVNITVLDLNDNSPQFDQNMYHVYAPEDSPLDSVVFVAQAVDEDSGLNARLTYTISPGVADRFSINRTTGAVTLKNKIRLGERLEFTVTATDGGQGARSSSADVVIEASDVNDHSPVFEQLEYHVAVSEGDLLNSRFLQVTATDDDLDDNGRVTYSLVSGVNITRPEFGVFPDGSLYVAQKLDRETKDRYQLLVQARDDGSPIRRTATALVHVKVIDDNDNTPQFSSSSYQFRVLEGKEAGTYIGSVSARDADAGRNADIMYFFTSSQFNFDLDPFTGEIRSKQVFDREQASKYSLTVQAIDNGLARRHSETSVEVIVEDVNDNSPTFSQMFYEIKMSEDVQPGEMINPITATDPDADINSLLEYSILSGNDRRQFSMDENSGAISVLSALDKEIQSEYELIIKASDTGDPPLSSNTTLFIRLLDANNRSPVFSRQSYSFNVEEDADLDSIVAHVTASDSDEGVNAIIEYSITQGNEDDNFDIVGETGEIRLIKALDYEFRQLYTLTVKASNRPPESLSSTTRISINVVDVNDNAPRFTDDVTTGFVSENASISTPVVKLTANDSDSGAHGRITYTIVSQPLPEKFLINRDGQIYTKALIDRENSESYDVTDQYTLVVEAKDQTLPVSLRLSARKSVVISVIDVNDNAPEFVSPPAGVVLENSASGTEVMTVSARDKDANRNGQVEYSLRSGTGYFSIDSVSGLITLTRSVSTSPVTHSITVRASDKGQPQKTAEQSIKIILTSSINSGLMVTSSETTKNILETARPGQNVLKFTTNEQNVEYYVTSVMSNGQAQPAYFSMSPRSLGQLQTAMLLDRDEGFVKYNVEIYVRDKGSNLPRTTKIDAEITLLDVNDSAPKFATSVFTAECSEQANVGLTVTTVTASDSDEDSTIAYTLSDSDGAFTINNQGQVKVAGVLDRETTSQYTLTITASDQSYSSRAELIITLTDVNDESPVFSKPHYSFSVSEKAGLNEVVGVVSAEDGDTGLGGVVEYRLVQSWGSDLFSINSNTGVVSLNGALNYEEVQLYVIRVEASDKDPVSPQTSTVILYINVIDENDNEPVFSPASYSPRLSEDADIGSVVVTVFASDDDAGKNGMVHYSILTNDAPFTIERTNGTITTVRSLDRESVSSYELVVQAEDFAIQNPLTSTATVSVTLTDINDNKPEFIMPHVLNVNESVPVNAVVGSVLAEDKDTGVNSRVVYSLMSNTQVFSVNSSSGEIKVLRALDRETTPSYTLRVKAEDQGTPRLSSIAEYTVTIEDSNDNSPQFSADQVTTVHVREDQAPGEVLLSLQATDADTGLAAEIRYYIIAGDPNEDFHLDQFSGKLSVSRVLDYERVRSYNLTIQAEDLGMVARFSTIDINVNVTDWNDNAPVFLHSPYYVYLQEEASTLPVELVTVQAFDADSPKYNQTTYQLVFGLDDDSDRLRSMFSINPTTGVLSAVQSVDRETTDHLQLKVIAQNTVSGSETLTGEAIVNVIVNDINDHAPEFDLPIYSTNVVEDQPKGQQVIRVTATDLDIGSNAEVRYVLVNNTAADYFDIDSVTGWIRNSETLDREELSQHDLQVVAYDLGDVSRSSTADVQIVVEDINDNSPSFEQDKYDLVLRDPTSVGEFVFGTTATDPDLGRNGTITYSLQGLNVAKFSLQRDTGMIKAAQRLSGSTLSLTVLAIDGGGRNDSVTLNITFEAWPVSALPVFQRSSSSHQLTEGSSANTAVATVTATVTSPGAEVLYQIVGGNIGNAFRIQTDGQIILDKKLDFAVSSVYELWIEARNSASGGKAYKNLTISIQDENDHVPEFEQALYITSMVEQQSIFGSIPLVQVSASDSDSGIFGNITYAIQSGNVGNPFILSTDGTLKLTKQLDRETIPRYEVVISATDGGGLSSTTIVIVNVLDINDMFPRFENMYRWDVAEDVSVGNVVSTVRARDGDIGENANIVYSLAQDSSNFAVTPSGNVTVTATLDRETQDSYEVVISARNTGPENVLTGTTTVYITVVDVNDNAPQFLPTSNYVFSFSENQQSGAVVGSVNTSDRDDDGPNSLVRYQLVSPSSFFLIDPVSGQIRSKEVMAYDVTGTHNIFTLFVEARDSGIPSFTSIASVNITILDANDHAPQFSQSSYFSAVPNDLSLNTEILTVSAVDTLDYGINADVSFSVVGGNGSSLFAVSRGNGTVYAKNALSGRTGEYRLVRVQAQDGGSPSQSTVVTVTLLITNDNRYTPAWVTAVPVSYNVSEAQNPGYVIGAVTASDSDTGINAEIVYSLQDNDFGIFSINPSSGQITLAKRLDYESKTVHQMTLQAKDKAFRPEQIWGVLTVNVIDADDNPPVFTQSVYTAEIAENSGSNVVVTSVTAYDADHGNNAVVRYAIIGDTSSRSYFDIDPISGEITAKESFDYEDRSSYNLIVKATNPHSSTHETLVTVRVSVKGVNEFPPSFIQNEIRYDVSESASVGYVLGQLLATDGDSGPDAEFEFLLVADSNNKGFSLDRRSGQLVVAEELDRESVETITLTALVKNPGPVRGNDTDTVRIYVNLDDANDSPKFNSSVYNASVQENQGSGVFVYQVYATDIDQQEGNRVFTYALEDSFDKFRIDPQNGKITTTASLDREDEDLYALAVLAVDQGQPPLTGQAIVYVQVTDVNDKSPYFVPTVPEGEIVENSQANTPVAHLNLNSRTFDDDIAPNQGPFRYSLTSPHFYIDENTGTVFTKSNNIDYETTKQYTLQVTVRDSGNRASQLQVRILVRDSNDQPSSPRDLTIIVESYDVPVNDVIGSVEPLDMDVVGNYTCTLNSQHFSLPGSGCLLRAFELTSDKSIKVQGSDGIHGHVQSSVQVKVNSYTDDAVDLAIVTRVSGVSAKEFVAASYINFLQAITDAAPSSQIARLISMKETGNFLDLYLVLQKTDGTYLSSLKSLITSNKATIERKSSVTIPQPARNVCNTTSCSGRGQCRSQAVMGDQLDYTSTDALTISYYSANLQPMCVCNQGWMGDDCSMEAGACISTPCLHGATCARVGETGFECECTPQWSGTQCERDVDECQSGEAVCFNGGTCNNEEGGYRCSCTEHFRGAQCEEAITCENRNPCQNSAICHDVEGGGYTCGCGYGFYGDLCQFSSYGFEEDSFMEYSPMDPLQNDIKMTLATSTTDSLLLFQPGLGNEFMALEIRDGNVVFTFTTEGNSLKGLTVSKRVSDTRWFRLHAVRTSNRASLEVMYCDAPNDCTRPCNSQSDCYYSIALTGSTNVNRINTGGKRLSIAGVESIYTLQPFASSVKSSAFTGCIGDIQLDGRTVHLDDAASQSNVMDTCPKLSKDDADASCAVAVCDGGDCTPQWFSITCTCDGFNSQTACDNVANSATGPKDVAIGADASLSYRYRESHRNEELLQLWSQGRAKRQISSSDSRLSLSFRTGKNAVLMRTEPSLEATTLQVVNGFVQYGSLASKVNNTSDGDWHDIDVLVTQSLVILTVDGSEVSEAAGSSSDFADIQTVSAVIIAEKYEGCIQELKLNDERLPMSDAQTDKFDIVVSGSDSIKPGCDGCPASVSVCGDGFTCDASSGRTSCVVAEPVKEGMAPVTEPVKEGMAPWLLAVIIVLSAVFIIATILIVVCLVMHCRKRKGMKKGSNAGMKPIITSQLSKPDNGHDNLPDRDILATEYSDTPRLHHNKSPAIAALQSSRTVPSPYQHLEDSTVIIEGSVTANSEKYNDQFYDFDEAASIAPSDVDIRKYYKGYRKGDNMEMHQMIPKHMRQQQANHMTRSSPMPHSLPRESPLPRQYAQSPGIRQSPLIMNGYDNNRQETPISQLQSRGLRHTPIDELNRRIAMEQHTHAARRDSESSLTDGSTIRQPHWTPSRNGTGPPAMQPSIPGSRAGSRPTSRQNSRPASRQQMSALANPISAQRQQDLNRLSHQSASSSIDDSDDDRGRRQPMERNIYSEGGDSSSDESSNDSFTASEFEADEPKVRNDYQPSNMMFTKLQEVEDESDTGDPNAYRTSFSWDGLRNVDTSLQRFIHNSDSNTDLESVTKSQTKSPKPTPFRWDHFLSWGPSFEKLVGVFADIAELPQDQHDEIDLNSIRSSEEYV